MGERITVRITDGVRTSPILYCHWSGPMLLEAVRLAVRGSRDDPRNVICNVVVEAMDFGLRDSGFYLYNDGECEGIADENWGDWTLDIRSMTWTTNYHGLEGQELTTHEALELLTITYDDPQEVNRMLFRPGRIVMTRGIADTIEGDISYHSEITVALERHLTGDWGDLSENDKQMNDDAIEAERKGEPTDRLFSAYDTRNGRIYIITEHDRSVTTVLYSDEY